jgi:hypothetical protein
MLMLILSINLNWWRNVISQDEEERHLKLVELNVIEQCNNLYKTGAIYEQVCWM